MCVYVEEVSLSAAAQNLNFGKKYVFVCLAWGFGDSSSVCRSRIVVIVRRPTQKKGQTMTKPPP
jgi:uncharacterized protein (DUF2252 family)